MAAADVTVARPRATPSERILGFITRTPVHLGLIVIAIIWLVPTVGLAVTSFRPRGEIQSSSWWSSLTHPDFTLENYTDVLNRANMDSAFVNSLIITALQIQPFVVTLATWSIAEGIAMTILPADGGTVPAAW